MKKLLKFLVFSGSLLLIVACGKEAPAPAAASRMVKKSISIDFQKNKNVFIAAALIVGRYYPKYLRNLHRRLHPGHAETTGTQ